MRRCGPLAFLADPTLKRRALSQSSSFKIERQSTFDINTLLHQMFVHRGHWTIATAPLLSTHPPRSCYFTISHIQQEYTTGMEIKVTSRTVARSLDIRPVSSTKLSTTTIPRPASKYHNVGRLRKFFIVNKKSRCRELLELAHSTDQKVRGMVLWRA
jgi:hypothetical protein